MTLKRFVKAFIAGMALPAVFLPFAYTTLYFNVHLPLPQHSFEFIPMFLPLVWGLANVIFVKLSNESKPKSVNSALWVTGLCLGFLVAVFGVFMMHLPTMIFGHMHGLQYAPLIIVPIIYGLLFRYVVKWINKVVGI